MIAGVGKFIKTHLRAADDFGPGRPRLGSDNPDVLEREFDRLVEQVDQLREPIEVSLEGSYNNLPTSSKLLLGAAAGAAVGGTLGGLHGFFAPAGDQFVVNVNWDTRPVMEQSLKIEPMRSQLTGMATQATSEGIVEVEVKAGVRYDFSHQIAENQVGEYRVPDGAEINHGFTTNAALSGLVGLSVGAGAGLLLTGGFLALKGLRSSEQEGVPPPVKPLVARGDLKTLALATTGGALAGAALGALDGAWEASRANGLSQEVRWQEPLMENNVSLGTVPRSASILIRHDVDFGNKIGDSQIYRSPSDFDLDRHIERSQGQEIFGQRPQRTLLNNIKMQEHTQTFEASPRYTVASAALGGAAVGGLVGLAAGVAYTTLEKMVEA